MATTATTSHAPQPGWEHRLHAVLALLGGEPVPHVTVRFGMGRSILDTWRHRALQALQHALTDHRPGPPCPHNRLSPEREQPLVELAQRHPTWSAAQIHAKAGPEAPSPRTIQRLRHRCELPRLPKRPAPRRPARCLTHVVKQEAHRLIETKPWLGPERLAWELQNAAHMQISPATIKRMKHAMQQAQTPPPPPPTWRFYARHHPHSLWHGDCLEKVFDQATGRQLYQVTLFEDYARGSVFCDLFDHIDPRTTIAARCSAMRHWQVIPKGVVFDQSGVFRGKLLEAFCRHLGIRLIHAAPQHPQTNGKLERAFRDEMPEFYRQQAIWELEALRRALPAYVQYRNEVRGHRALGGRPAITRLAEQHRMAVPWVLDSLEQYARYPMMQKKVTPEGCLGLFRRQVYLDVALSGQEITCYETVDGLEVRGANHRVYLLREYRRWQNRYWWNWGQELPEDFRFEPYTPPVCPWIAVA
jgi:transposase InsO family protein/transposase